MIELLEYVLVAVGLTTLGALVITEIAHWRNRQHQARLRRVERGLVQAQKRLETLALQHAAWLDERSHEARKALIMESFRAVQKARDSANNKRRC